MRSHCRLIVCAGLVGAAVGAVPACANDWMAGPTEISIEIASLLKPADKPGQPAKRKPAGEPIRIATVGPMTGRYAQFGRQLKLGADQAVADLNARGGGVLGRKVVLEIADDRCDSQTAIAVANKLAAQKTFFVDGHFCSGSSIPASRVYANAKIVEISPASTNPEYTDARQGPGVLRLAGRDDELGPAAGTYIAKNFGGKKVAILDDHSSYGLSFAVTTREALKESGVTPDLSEVYVPGGKDYSRLVSKLKDADIGVVVIGGYPAEAGQIVREVRKQGLAAQIVGPDSLQDPIYWQIAGRAAEGTLVAFIADPVRSPAAAGVVREYRRRGQDGGGYILYAYAAVQVWAEAAEKAGSPDFDAVVKELANGSFPSVLGDVSFDSRGDVRTPSFYVMYAWHHGRCSQL
jgi:branched-chain amino acid transport system substrate-binding protein